MFTESNHLLPANKCNCMLLDIWSFEENFVISIIVSGDSATKANNIFSNHVDNSVIYIIYDKTIIRGTLHTFFMTKTNGLTVGINISKEDILYLSKFKFERFVEKYTFICTNFDNDDFHVLEVILN